ncbi:MAG: hypothetical protein D6743_06325 [Calditrichaeota bacterium]|nr:MAG: hypothetical protein D6743_06325 [Calditrichota bacterium]
MIKTLSLKEVEKYADSIYEAIIVIAKRSRQINDEQKQLIMQETEESVDFDGYDEEAVDFEVMESRSFLRLPKPTTVALEEFFSGKLSFEYRVPEEEEPPTV